MSNFNKVTHSFDDVLLVPQKSDIVSRSEVDLASELTEGLVVDLPIISSPMDTVTEKSMAFNLTEIGGLAVVHRYCSVEEQIAMLPVVRPAVAIGVSGDYKERLAKLYDARVRIYCLDVAHGHHTLVESAW